MTFEKVDYKGGNVWIFLLKQPTPSSISSEDNRLQADIYNGKEEDRLFSAPSGSLNQRDVASASCRIKEEWWYIVWRTVVLWSVPDFSFHTSSVLHRLKDESFPRSDVWTYGNCWTCKIGIKRIVALTALSHIYIGEPTMNSDCRSNESFSKIEIYKMYRKGNEQTSHWYPIQR